MPVSNRAAATVTVYAVFFLCLLLLLSLGGWQWRRGVEKAAIEALLDDAPNHYITLARAPPNWSALAYREVRLQGEWRSPAPLFLLANRIHRGRPGYEVFSVFQLAADNATLLVNRGWIALADATAHSLRAAPTHPPAVTGQLYLPQTGFVLGPAHRQPPGEPPAQPIVIQYVDIDALSPLAGGDLQPAVVALDTAHPAAFERIWQPYTLTKARHFGYAVQWWGLAATLLVFGFIWRRQARQHQHHHR